MEHKHIEINVHEKQTARAVTLNNNEKIIQTGKS